jgi:hypothetical protein
MATDRRRFEARASIWVAGDDRKIERRASSCAINLSRQTTRDVRA